MAVSPQKTKNIVFLAGGLFILLVGLYGATFYFLKSESERASMVLEQQMQGESKRANLESFKKMIADTSDKRAQLNTFFLTPDNVIDFIGNVEAWGAKTGVKATLSGLREQDAHTLSFSAQADGSFENVTSFMKLLENLPYDVHLDQVTLVNQVEGDKKIGALWHGTFTVRITSYIGDATNGTTK